MDHDLLLKLHERICMGDPIAPDQLVSEYLVPLQTSLRRGWLLLPREAVQDAVVDALLTYLQRPDAFDPQRSPSLLAYLKMIASRRLTDALRKQMRLNKRERSVGGVVEINQYGSNMSAGTWPPAFDEEGDPDALPPEIEEMLNNLFPEPRDRRLLKLICQGRQETSAYAAILGIGSLLESEQRRIVKQHRDRILKRLRRHQKEFLRFWDD